jgi:ABC-type taurine transport system ATPase subunit
MRQWSEADELAVEEALRLTGTAEFAHLPVDSLSGGQRQRCWIAMALAQQTPPFCSMSRPPGSICAIRSISSSCSRPHPRTWPHGGDGAP